MVILLYAQALAIPDKDGNPTNVGQDDVVVVVANPTDLLEQNDDDDSTFESNFA